MFPEADVPVMRNKKKPQQFPSYKDNSAKVPTGIIGLEIVQCHMIEDR
jgi:hypothetical protein